jgi:hypothetical protein
VVRELALIAFRDVVQVLEVPRYPLLMAGSSEGPFAKAQIQEKLAAGQITADRFVSSLEASNASAFETLSRVELTAGM